MKVEMKGYKRFNGHDGQGFDASIYIDGVRSAVISDDGWGGGINWHILSAQQEAVVKLGVACSNLPPMEFQDSELKMDVDLWIEENLTKFADTKKQCGNKVTMYEDGEFYTMTKANKYKAKFRKEWEKEIHKKYPNAILVNGMEVSATI